MDRNAEKHSRAIPLQTIIIFMVSVCIIISCILALLMFQTSNRYREMRLATENYMDCQRVANDLLAGSDALTIYARGYVVTGDPQQAELYYNDTRTQTTIDEAVSEIRNYSTDERVLSQLNYAMQLRDRLSVAENYAIKLKTAAIGADIPEYPEELQSVQLLPADIRLSPSEQEEKARSLLFDMEYESSKNEISIRINRGMEILMKNMLDKQSESSDRMMKVLYGQHFMTAALIISILALSVIVFTMVILPVRRAIDRMSNGKKLDEEGTSEIRFLARTYNVLCEHNRIATEELHYEATHDGLTGLYNRSAYASMLDRLSREGLPLALMVADVDLFKQINDGLGHDTGDSVLKTVGEVLEEAFRKEDMVCRIGGDEFAVIMTNTDSGCRSVVSDKLKLTALKLANPENEGIPGVTLSVGVAFTDTLSENDGLFKSADLALYKVKKSGRNGCGFFVEDGRIEITSYPKEKLDEREDRP